MYSALIVAFWLMLVWGILGLAYWAFWWFWGPSEGEMLGNLKRRLKGLTLVHPFETDRTCYVYGGYEIVLVQDRLGRWKYLVLDRGVVVGQCRTVWGVNRLTKKAKAGILEK